MSRQNGALSMEYQERLAGMSLEEIVAEAAKYRSDGRRCGTATAQILRWAAKNTGEDTASILNSMYQKAWSKEKALRLQGESKRPAQRPATGGRPRRRTDRERSSFAFSC